MKSAIYGAVVLSGHPPFNGTSEQEIFLRIKKGEYNISQGEWKTISNEAKDLINKLLIKDINQRLSASEALNHPWFKKKNEIIDSKYVDHETVNNISFNIKNYKAEHKLQQAGLGFIVRNMTKEKDIKIPREAFEEFDQNKDGRLTKKELIKALSKVMPTAEATQEVDRVIELIDTDYNGYIEYEEFIRASINKNLVLSDENLFMAFQEFDTENKGHISIESLKFFFGDNPEIPENLWKDMLDKIDQNKDGVISFKEFKEMMKDIINKE